MRLQAESAVHSLFLINRKQGLDRSVTQAIVRQHGHRQSGAHAIVRPQSRLTGRHPITVYVSVDRIFLEIMLYGRVFLGNHIQMRLQCHGLTTFHSGRSRLTDQYVTHLILQGFQSQSFTKGYHKTGYCLHMSGRTGDLRKVIKITPYMLRR